MLGDKIKSLITLLTKSWDEKIVKPIQTWWVDMGKIWDEKIVKPVQQIWADLTKGWNDNVITPVQTFWADLTKGWNDNVITPVKNLWDTIGQTWNDWVTTPAKKLWQKISDAWDNLVGDKVKAVENTVDTVKQDVSNTVNSAETSVSNTFNSAKNAVGSAVSSSWNSIANFLSPITNAAEKRTTQELSSNGQMGDPPVPGRQPILQRFASSIKQNVGKSPLLKSVKAIMSKPKKQLRYSIGDPAELSDAQIVQQFGYAMKGPASDVTQSDLKMMYQLSKQYGVDLHLWLAMVELESSFNSKEIADDPCLAAGWGQVTKDTGKGLYEDGLKLGTYNHATMGTDKEINTRMSMYYLASLIQQKNGNINDALIAYNGNEKGQAYPNVVANNLKKNAGLTFADIIPGNPTNVNTYAGSGNTSSSSDGISGFMGALSSGFTSVFGNSYGFNVTDLATAAGTVAAGLDPFKGLFKPSNSASASNQTTAADTSAYGQQEASKYKFITGKTTMHDFLANRLDKIGKDHNQPVDITSGYRDDAEQAQLVKQWYIDHGKTQGVPADDWARRQMVADPGQSMHGLGLAADVNNPWLKALDNTELAKYGLWKPMPDREDWHIEPIEDQIIGKHRPELDSVTGTPTNPASGLTSYADSKYFDSSLENVGDPPRGIAAKLAIAKMRGAPTANIGDPPTTLTGAPSASSYSNNLSTALQTFKNGAYTQFEQEALKFMRLIAEGVQSLVGLSSDTKDLLSHYMAMGVNAGSSKQSVAILPMQQQSKPVNPFISGASNTNKQSKATPMMAIASGTMT